MTAAVSFEIRFREHKQCAYLFDESQRRQKSVTEVLVDIIDSHRRHQLGEQDGHDHRTADP